MSSPARTWLPVAVLVALIVVIGAGALWFPPGSRERAVATALFGGIPTAATIWQYSYHRIERHRLWVDRWLFRLRNSESQWSITAEFDVGQLGPSFQAAADAVDGSSNASRLASTSGNCVWQVDGSTVRLTGDTSAGGTGIIRVDFPPAPRQFRTWPSVIDDTVDVVISAVQDAIPAGNRKFVAYVGFPGPNPYFGYFIARVPASAVRRFEIELVVPTVAGADRVLVRRDRIELVTSSLAAVRQLSRRYLSLVPMDVA